MELDRLFSGICEQVDDLSSRPIGEWPQPGTISDDRVAIVGHKNWAFLYGGTNDYYRSYIEDDQQSTGDIEAWLRYLTYWADWCKRGKIKFAFAIVPNKASVLPDLYPMEMNQGITFRMKQLQQRIGSLDSILTFPLNKFRTPRLSETIFRRNDSHLTEAGVILMASEILSKLDIPPEVLNYSGKFTAVKSPGDLGQRFQGGALEEVIRIRRALNAINVKVLTQPQSGRGFTGLAYETKHDAAAIKGKLLVFGNSFFERVPSWGMGPDFARIFSQVRFHWSNSIDHLVIDEWKPDYVVLQTCERFLNRIPDALIP